MRPKLPGTELPVTASKPRIDRYSLLLKPQNESVSATTYQKTQACKARVADPGEFVAESPLQEDRYRMKHDVDHRGYDSLQVINIVELVANVGAITLGS